MSSAIRRDAVHRLVIRAGSVFALLAALFGPTQLAFHLAAEHGHAAISGAVATQMEAGPTAPLDDASSTDCPTCEVLCAAQLALQSAPPATYFAPVAVQAEPARHAATPPARAPLFQRSRAPPLPV
jgi:hypothetical protein